MSKSGSTSFDEASRDYLESPIFSEGEDLDRIEDWLGSCETVLDVGAGTLHTAGRLHQAGVPRVVALDPSRGMLREGRNPYPEVKPVSGLAESMPFQSNQFDGAVCRYAAHHFEEPELFFREAKRILQPTDRLVFQDLVIPADDPLGKRMNEIAKLRDPSHEQYRSPDQWQTIIERNGFDVPEVVRFTLPLSYEDWIERQDPPPASRQKIKELFGELTVEQRNRINATMEDDRPERFEYPVAILHCRVNEI